NNQVRVFTKGYWSHLKENDLLNCLVINTGEILFNRINRIENLDYIRKLSITFFKESYGNYIYNKIVCGFVKYKNKVDTPLEWCDYHSIDWITCHDSDNLTKFMMVT